MTEQTTVQRKSDLTTDIQTIRSQVEDGLAMGDSMFGRFAHAEVAREVKERTEELQRKKEELEREIQEKEALIQRVNRDFSDEKNKIPETLEQERIRFIEDYTLLFLSLAYVFMVVSAIVFYVMISEQKPKAFAKGLGYAIVGTLLAYLLLNWIA